MAYDSSSYKPQVDEVGQIILDARNVLSDPERWVQVGAVVPAHAYCIYTALDNSRFASYLKAIERIVIALGHDPRTHGTPAIFAFNDDPSTTHAMVLDLLDRAASPTKEA